jgi:hypothetical protein
VHSQTKTSTTGQKGAISSDEDCTEISWTHHTSLSLRWAQGKDIPCSPDTLTWTNRYSEPGKRRDNKDYRREAKLSLVNNMTGYIKNMKESTKY